MLIKACLNGNRKAEEHSVLPLFPDELGWDGRRVVEVGPARCTYIRGGRKARRCSKQTTWERHARRCTPLARTSRLVSQRVRGSSRMSGVR